MSKTGVLFGIVALAVGIWAGNKLAPKFLAYLPRIA